MPAAAEREILGYLIETGFIDDRLVALANQVLAGRALSHEEQAAFRQGIAEKWFRLDCEQCNCAVAIEDIPLAIELGDALCPRCRCPDGDAGLLDLPNAVLGGRQFTDGAVRRVFAETDGRQFVLDDDDDRVFGVWLSLEEIEPDPCVCVPKCGAEIQAGASFRKE
jgi:hypothetical protein